VLHLLEQDRPVTGLDLSKWGSIHELRRGLMEGGPNPLVEHLA
jgi:hypothetical protein